MRNRQSARFRRALRRRHRAYGLPTPRPEATPYGRSLAVATGDSVTIRATCPPKVLRWLDLDAPPRVVIRDDAPARGKSTSPDIHESGLLHHGMPHDQPRSRRNRLAPFADLVRLNPHLRD